MVSHLSQACSIALKEWAGVCDALACGRQTVIIRKGGISESTGPGGFAPEHAEFWLYPTWVHQAEQGLRPFECPSIHAPGHDGSVPIRAMVRVEHCAYVEHEETLRSLGDFHVFTDETIRKRFHYRRPGLWVLGVRVWTGGPGFALNPTPEQAGCKSWVFLDEPLATTGLAPVIETARWVDQIERLWAILDRPR
jgi:hypothetical protein